MKTIACFGSGDVELEQGKLPFQYERMREIGRLLAERGIRVATGGYGGSGMEAPVRGASEANGLTIGYVLKCRSKTPNPYLNTIVQCGGGLQIALGMGKEKIISSGTDAMQYCLRLGCLLQADGFVVDPTDPTPGTLIEFLSVVNLNKKFWTAKPKPIAVISDNISEALRFMHGIRTLPVEPFIHITVSPEEAVEWLIHEMV